MVIYIFYVFSQLKYIERRTNKHKLAWHMLFEENIYYANKYIIYGNWSYSEDFICTILRNIYSHIVATSQPALWSIL